MKSLSALITLLLVLLILSYFLLSLGNLCMLSLPLKKCANFMNAGINMPFYRERCEV